jgi:3-oxoacyl-[acyl-carrier-protein] synthase-3
MRSAPLAERSTGAGRPTRTAGVLGLGHHLPETVVSNLPIAERLGIDESWIVKRTGIKHRRHAMPSERLSDLATAAAQNAVKDAGVDPTALDAILVATTSADEITPNAAPYVATALGAKHANAFDVGAACTAFVTALSAGTSLIESGRAETVLVVGADALSRFTDFDDKRSAALFGDGAGAVVLGAQEDGDGVGQFVFGSDATLAEAIIARRDDPVLRMDGHTTFNAAVGALERSTRQAVELAGMTLDDIDLFVYHQANARITRSVAEKLGLPSERVADYIAETGNTSAASIPLALTFAREEDRLHPGDTVLMAAVGAGFTWGAAVVQWGGAA